ncbi:Hypothetical predicted protein [Mytilus galloprovincialis]|uniref:Helicase C-terminal domain-containing protein n=1 Tax=Mytilus galloprovincialis TaxID=29158 RepID=A0A8B6HDI7_MYTGA|nr:Hypothetical predicted protein [Mytilus galloprovincialis]
MTMELNGDEIDDFKSIQTSNLIFSTPQFFCNRLMKAAVFPQLSIGIFTLIIIDECHHAHRRSVYNGLMSYYRLAKYGQDMDCLPQIVGLTSLPGLDEVRDLTSAKDYLHQIMANLAVNNLSVVNRNKEELLQYTSSPQKVFLSPTPRQNDTLKNLLLEAMAFVESKMNSRIVSEFLTENQDDIWDLQKAISIPLVQRTDILYLQWLTEATRKVETLLYKNFDAILLLHACLRHLKLYAECLEINSLFDTDHVDVIMKGDVDKAFDSQNATTLEIVYKLRDVVAEIRESSRTIEGKTDIQVIIENIESNYKRLKKCSRFVVLVKTRAAATALEMRLPGYLRSTYLAGLQKSLEEGEDDRTRILENFKNGEHLCIVATSDRCKGLDFPSCNMVINYRIESDDKIIIFQMLGNVGRNEEQELIAGTSTDFGTEKKNIQQQYLIAQAIEEISESNIARDIAIAEKNIFEIEEIIREAEKI